ncbi:MAG: AsmA family protein [Verrucomicrobia bacterium]|nr:AsmA family protein [Verrucomicrobiota bacterium]
MRKALRWSIYIFLVLIILLVVGIFSINPIAKSAAEKRLKAETGMETTIGKFDLGLRSQTLRITDLKLINPPEFGGSTFVYIPELFIELDANALRENKLHLRNLRLDLAEIHVVENKDGKKNTDIFQKSGDSGKRGRSSTNATSENIQFAGIDHLAISLGTAKFTSERYPNRNYERTLGVRDRTFKDIKTEKDLEVVGVLIIGQVGLSALLEGIFTSPSEVIEKGSAAGKETQEILKDLVAPLNKK